MPLPVPHPRTKAAKRKDAQFVMHEFKGGMLHTGSPKGPVVHNRQQAIAIMMSETGQAKPSK